MQKFIAALLLAGTSSALKMSKMELQKYNSLVQVGSEYANQCHGAIDRIKNEPAAGYTEGTKFTDESFPTDEAFGWSAYNSAESVYALNSSKYWFRISDATGLTLKGNDDQFSVNDIRQGMLGDCYFLAALSSIAENNEDVAGIFDQTELNADGMYTVWAWPKGVPQQIRLDDYMPSNSATSFRPTFSKNSEDGSVWVPILEKYWAKLNGNYAQIEGGWVSEGVQQLMGSPGFFSNLSGKTTQELYNQISTYDKERTYMSAGSKSDTCGQLGIVGGHAYSIHGAYWINDTNGQK